MKKLIAMLLLVCAVLGLCACGSMGSGETEPQKTEPQPTVAQPTAAEETEGVPEGMAEYVAYVVDEGGNPVPNVMVQICKDTCFPTSTDENGKAVWTREEAAGYKVSFMLGVPEGYAYVDETVTDFYFEGSSKEITIVLKAVA